MSNRYYVYILVDPRNGEPFYIGKGSGRRVHEHEANTRNGKIDNADKCAKIHEIWVDRFEVEKQIVASDLSECDALAMERHLILTTPDLTNIQHGQAHAQKTSLEKLVAWAKYRLPMIKPFGLWVSEEPRTRDDIAAYHLVANEIRQLAGAL